MADFTSSEVDEHGKKKAKIMYLGEGSSSVPSISPNCERNKGEFDGGGAEVESDPLAVFGNGIMMMILSKLDARSVALCRSVSRQWMSIASCDKIWAPKDPIDIIEIGI